MCLKNYMQRILKLFRNVLKSRFSNQGLQARSCDHPHVISYADSFDVNIKIKQEDSAPCLTDFQSYLSFYLDITTITTS